MVLKEKPDNGHVGGIFTLPNHCKCFQWNVFPLGGHFWFVCLTHGKMYFVVLLLPHSSKLLYFLYLPDSAYIFIELVPKYINDAEARSCAYEQCRAVEDFFLTLTAQGYRRILLSWLQINYHQNKIWKILKQYIIIDCTL